MPYCITVLWQWAKGSGPHITATTGKPTPTDPLEIATVNNYPFTWLHYRACKVGSVPICLSTEHTTRKVEIYSHSCPCFYMTWRRKWSGGTAPCIPLGTKWRWVASFTLHPLYPHGGKATDTHWIGGWVHPKAGPEAVKRRISYPYQESNPQFPLVQPPDNSYTCPPKELVKSLSCIIQYEIMI
jgi:hypothetical protein